MATMNNKIEIKEKEKRIRIIISSGSGEAEGSDVTVGVNGVHYQIKRDVEVEVPEAVVHVLRNATMDMPVTDEHGTVIRTKKVPRFPFQVLN